MDISQYTNPEFLLVMGIVIAVVAVSYLLKKKKESGDGGTKSVPRGTSVLEQYSTNFTELARKHDLNPVVGRQREVDHLVQILSRKTKNNALLLGEPGVGKTSVVERLALLIVQGKVPESIQDKEVIALDLSSLVSGTKYRGELEKRLNTMREEFRSQEKSVILFIDEIQQLSQAKGSEGGLNPGDILKPELARGHLQIIGATTYTDYEKYVLPEESLERRFQPIHVHEPEREEALEIIKGVKDVFAKFHKVQYTDDALEAIIDYSKKYIHKRYLPDKAIDVLDEAGVRARLQYMRNKKEEGQEEQPEPVVDVDTIKHVVAEWAEIDFNEIKQFNIKREVN